MEVQKQGIKLLAVLSAMPDVTIAELANAMGLSIAGVRWNLKKLKDAQKIQRVGPDKGRHWKVL